MTTNDETSAATLASAQPAVMPQQRTDTVPDVMLGGHCGPTIPHVDCCGARIDAPSPDDPAADDASRATESVSAPRIDFAGRSAHGDISEGVLPPFPGPARSVSDSVRESGPTVRESLHGRKLVLVASTGGHLDELVRLSAEFQPHPDSLWITFDSPQSRGLLAGRRHIFIPYVRPRDWRAVLTARRMVSAATRGERFDAAVTTGAGIAIGAFAALAVRRVPLCYIESVGRVSGPSLTGRIFAATRRTEVWTQHPQWASSRWRPGPGILDRFTVTDVRCGDRHENAGERVGRVFVTLGTIQPYRFDAAVDAVVATGAATHETVWQLGATMRSDVPGTAYGVLDPEDFEKHVRDADVVVAHAGVGTLLHILDAGRVPVVLVRRSSRGEHVDDHQVQIARLLAAKGVAVVAEPAELTVEHLRRAAGMRVTRASPSLHGRSRRVACQA